MKLLFEIAGKPVPKGRARTRVVTAGDGRAFATHYTPTETRKYEQQVKHEAMIKMAGRPPIDAPIRMMISAYIQPPKSWSNKKRAAALAGDIRPTARPDLDNYEKAACDGMNEVVYRDDSLIVEKASRKLFSERPRIVIQVETIGGDDDDAKHGV